MAIELAYFPKICRYYINGTSQEMKMNEKEDISITAKFFANLRSVAPPKKTISLPRGSTVNAILEMFGISEEVKLIILINGTPHQKRETVIKNGDIVAIFPPLAGG